MRHNIAAICMHTNLDAAEGGVNDVLARTLGLDGPEMLTDEKIGRVGTLKCEIPIMEFLPFVIESLEAHGLCPPDERVKKLLLMRENETPASP